MPRGHKQDNSKRDDVTFTILNSEKNPTTLKLERLYEQGLELMGG